jgi:integrase
MVFKNGRFYWYEFTYNGQRYRKSTRQRSERAAIDIEAAKRTQLAKGDVGLEQRPPAPTLAQFEKTFVAWVRRTKPNLRTQEFYETNFSRLLDFKPFAGTRLDQIDEAMIERFKIAMDLRGVSKTTVNRRLSTLRKALRYASRSLKLFDRLPVVAMYSKDDGPDVEREREFIFSDVDYRNWLATAPEPLRSASVLAREAGICRGELLSMERDCVVMLTEPNEKGLYGFLDIRRGLKRRERRRKLPITAAMREALLPLLQQSRCEFVFTSLTDRTKPLSPWTLEDQLGRTKKLLKLDSDAGLHSLRHTLLTAKGRTTDVWTLQRIAGHARITTTQRYVHPEVAAVEDAFAATTTPKTTPTPPALKKEPAYN